MWKERIVMISAQEALKRLREGNRRFLSNASRRDHPANHRSPAELAAKQEPFAIVLGCSDSRVVPEIIFDQGLGDLFVIRVAGNIVAPAEVGSIEFAVERFGTPLLVVLGHSRCGAVQATIEALRQPSAGQSRGLRSIVDRIRLSVEGPLKAEPTLAPDDLVRQAVRANTLAAVNDLRGASKILERRIQEKLLAVACAEYSLETGVVEFFGGADAG
jgi:carbonic anhydrase